MRTISVKNIFMQPTKDGNKLLKQAMLNNYVRDLIDEHATYQNGGLSLYVSELSLVEKKILLSHLADCVEDYEFFCETESQLEAAFKDYKSSMQRVIDENINDSYVSAMEECGKVLCHHQNNGEGYYSKRIW